MMRFTDEKVMWYADVKMLAKELCNKSEREVMEVLARNDVIKLHSGKRPKQTALARLSQFVIVPILIPISFLKWIITGDRYLNSWCKKSRALDAMMNYISND